MPFENFYETIILVGIILILVDFVIPTDVSSILAHGLFALAITHAIGAPILYSVIIGILCWASLILLHYWLFKKYVATFVNTYIAKSKLPDEPLHRLIGTQATIESHDGKLLARLEGDLMPFTSADSLAANDAVTVIAINQGIPVLQKDTP
ncbi:hypothetical protein [Rubritalea tangerina]|uniref:NfeD-like C-terminal domain-containing protein n=1 Tax=Rubritalea tangerina TaxID=430798 RepID=A0ABW4ZFG6_9BACT